MSFKQEILNSLLRGRVVATELSASSDKTRKWAAVYPILRKPYNISGDEIHYRLMIFEINKTLVEEYFGDEDILNKKVLVFETEASLYEEMKLRGINPRSICSALALRLSAVKPLGDVAGNL